MCARLLYDVQASPRGRWDGGRLSNSKAGGVVSASAVQTQSVTISTVICQLSTAMCQSVSLHIWLMLGIYSAKEDGTQLAGVHVSVASLEGLGGLASGLEWVDIQSSIA